MSRVLRGKIDSVDTTAILTTYFRYSLKPPCIDRFAYLCGVITLFLTACVTYSITRSMKTINLEIQGVSPLLINRFKEQDEIPVNLKKGKKDYGTPREQAEGTPYFDAKTKLLWIPSSWVMGTIRMLRQG